MKTAVRCVVWTAVVVALLSACTLLPQFGGTVTDGRLDRIRQSPQFVDGSFANKPPQEPLDVDKSWRMIKKYLGGQVRQPRGAIPVVELSARDFDTASPGLRLYWFGHSSVLIEIDGLRIMTDPVFSERVSPFDFVGPRRLHRSPLALAEMPRLDAVLISHDHYDHLDMPSIKHFAAGGTHFYVGLGIGAHLERWGVAADQIHEMDWWEALPLGPVTIHSTPARHYSGRKYANNSTLWSSWYIEGDARAVYYSGDTGYTDHFSAIRARLGPPEVAIMKVGAYGDPWLDIHMDPESAIQAQLDLGAQILLPVHWATYNLAYHAWDEPIERTLAAAAARGVEVVTPRVGERYVWGEPSTSTDWWRSIAAAAADDERDQGRSEQALLRHAGESRDPVQTWIPAFAGKTAKPDLP